MALKKWKKTLGDFSPRVFLFYSSVAQGSNSVGTSIGNRTNVLYSFAIPLPITAPSLCPISTTLKPCSAPRYANIYAS